MCDFNQINTQHKDVAHSVLDVCFCNLFVVRFTEYREQTTICGYAKHEASKHTHKTSTVWKEMKETVRESKDRAKNREKPKHISETHIHNTHTHRKYEKGEGNSHRREETQRERRKPKHTFVVRRHFG